MPKQELRAMADRSPAAPARSGDERSSAQVEAAISLAGALAAPQDMAALLDRTLAWAVAMSRHDQGSIMLTERGGRALSIRAVVGQDPARIGTVVPTAQPGVATWVLKHRRHLYLEGSGSAFEGQRSYTKDVPSAIVLPLLTTQGVPLGVLSLNATRGAARLSDEDIAVLQAMANLVGIVIDNAALYHALRVKDQQLQDAATQVMSAQEEERRRVAYEIHDGVAQTIVGIYQTLQSITARRVLRSAQAIEELDQAQQQLRQTVEEVRRIIADLRPSVLDDFGLETALRRMLADRSGRAGWILDLAVSLKGPPLPPHLETAVFRMVQEASSNALKYAGTARLQVRVLRGRRWLTVTVRDWGKGFRPEAAGAPAAGHRVGLDGMRSRAEILGGTLRVFSRPGRGTHIEARLPLPRGETY